MAKTPLQFYSPKEIAQLLSQRVRLERLRREWKQQTLAERAGVSLPTLRRYERTGQTSLANLFKLCHALGYLDDFANLLKPPSASSIEELAAQNDSQAPKHKRGRR